jgi:hypothetical protein
MITETRYVEVVHDWSLLRRGELPFLPMFFLISLLLLAAMVAATTCETQCNPKSPTTLVNGVWHFANQSSP